MTFGGTNVMRSVLNLDETQPAMEQPFKATARFKRQLPTDIEVECVPLIKFHPQLKIFMLKHERTIKNADLDTRENVGFDKVLQTKRQNGVN